ncbi:hypothetical protein HanIR_Chr15g0733771 [Helianthus annuus]|nr:hypothetical protein HanIR_Chr15g0733771 [Helianthus annuus]
MKPSTTTTTTTATTTNHTSGHMMMMTGTITSRTQLQHHRVCRHRSSIISGHSSLVSRQIRVVCTGRIRRKP